MNDNHFNPLALVLGPAPARPPLLLLLAVLLGYAHAADAERPSPERLIRRSPISASRAGMWLLALLQQRLLSMAVPAYLLGVVLLLAVELFERSGVPALARSRRGAHPQPSELMKIAMPLMLAWFFQMREARPASSRLLSPPACCCSCRWG